ncbi:hypothetical protein TRFO_18143 [Tritrichomonas foetus]|uniref:non-specific serine/threonine protein kinase n=1 Tax=Tritrichomonas foetus TaxID=1144522 RepID=A0A1J4KMK2_9EUKA|nr:hypothetical protein TRFO_18143 [Tritrichomonas foetus]|eukprot:OHT12152.1 hypothetical protein TRFO_18143 [Tritrichomonas foetus]
MNFFSEKVIFPNFSQFVMNGVGNMNSLVHFNRVHTSLNNVTGINQSYPAIYNRSYLQLKAQHTVLENLLPRIEKPPKDMTWEDQQKLSFIGYLIESLKQTTFGNLFQAADNTIASIRNLLNSKSIHPENEKILTTLMNAALTINQISNHISAIYSSPQAQIENAVIEMPAHFSEDVVVCRICDQRVPASLLEEHTESCLTRYRSESKINDINDRIKKLQECIEKEYLEHAWPGPLKQGVEVLFPNLHLLLLLERAINLDPNITDTIDELMFIQSVINSFQTADFSKVYTTKASILVNEKIKTSNALNDATIVLRQTRVSGSQDELTQTTIADFNFIKRISRGAYASVFLATKKTTGDIFAIKVTPKSSLKQKNQVRRILIEKDILLQFSNPFIVTFCMFNFY